MASSSGYLHFYLNKPNPGVATLHGMPEFNTVALENLDLKTRHNSPAPTPLRPTSRPGKDKHKTRCAVGMQMQCMGLA